MHDALLQPSAPSRDTFVVTPLRERTGALLAGEADFTARDILRAALAALAAVGAREELHLDLAGLGFMDVCCARELIAVTERHPGVRLVVSHPPASLRRIIAILRPEVRIEFIDVSPPGSGEADGLRGRAWSDGPPPTVREEAPTPDIVELILGEHIRIRKLVGLLDAALLGAVPAGPESEPALAWAALARFLGFHVDAAEEIAYRALAGASPDAAAAVRRVSEADADIRAAAGEARLSAPGSPAWHLAVEAVSSAAKSHIARLESGPLPCYRRRAALGARRVLGCEWEAFMASRALDASAA